MKTPIFFFLTLAISGCAVLDSDKHGAACRELKSQILFSGATSDTRQRNIQEAEEPLKQWNYDCACPWCN